MTRRRKHQVLTSFIAAVWLVNGLVCKILNIVPRHQEIVGRILGEDHARMLTILIGFSEIMMAVWIITGFWTRVNAMTQILIIASMNIIEFSLASDLLLWGKMNALFAFLFILLVGYNEFRLNQNSGLPS